MSFRFPAAFNVIATLITFGTAVGLSWMAWNYYEYTPWTRDGRVRVYTVPLAPEVSGTVVSLAVKDDQYVRPASSRVPPARRLRRAGRVRAGARRRLKRCRLRKAPGEQPLP